MLGNIKKQTSVNKFLGGREKVRVAVIQAASNVFNKDKLIDKACRMIKEAGANLSAIFLLSLRSTIPALTAMLKCSSAGRSAFPTMPSWSAARTQSESAKHAVMQVSTV